MKTFLLGLTLSLSSNAHATRMVFEQPPLTKAEIQEAENSNEIYYAYSTYTNDFADNVRLAFDFHLQPDPLLESTTIKKIEISGSPLFNQTGASVDFIVFEDGGGKPGSILMAYDSVPFEVHSDRLVLRFPHGLSLMYGTTYWLSYKVRNTSNYGVQYVFYPYLSQTQIGAPLHVMNLSGNRPELSKCPETFVPYKECIESNGFKTYKDANDIAVNVFASEPR